MDECNFESTFRHILTIIMRSLRRHMSGQVTIYRTEREVDAGTISISHTLDVSQATQLERVFTESTTIQEAIRSATQAGIRARAGSDLREQLADIEAQLEPPIEIEVDDW